MIKIIETNIALSPNDTFIDFQSRVVQVSSWEDYINEYRQQLSIERSCIIGNLEGKTLPTEARIEELEFDNFHLSCIVYWRGLKAKKLAYLTEEGF